MHHMTEAAFLSYEEFMTELGNGSGLMLFMLTARCDDAAHGLARELGQTLGDTVPVRVMCAQVTTSPTLVYYEGGDHRPLLTRIGPDAVTGARADVVEARLIATSRGRALQQELETEQMLATEQVDTFPPFFQMARALARDAWHVARQSVEGAPLLLASEAAAERLAVCERCPSLHGDRCVECGCFMLVKAHIAAMDCPLHKWPPRLQRSGDG